MPLRILFFRYLYLTRIVTTFGEEVAASIDDLIVDSNIRCDWICCDSSGDIVVNEGFLDLRVDSGSWKLEDVNVRSSIVFIALLYILSMPILLFFALLPQWNSTNEKFFYQWIEILFNQNSKSTKYTCYLGT